MKATAKISSKELEISMEDTILYDLVGSVSPPPDSKHPSIARRGPAFDDTGEAPIRHRNPAGKPD
jgi:hypothetical protein